MILERHRHLSVYMFVVFFTNQIKVSSVASGGCHSSPVPSQGFGFWKKGETLLRQPATLKLSPVVIREAAGIITRAPLPKQSFAPGDKKT